MVKNQGINGVNVLVESSGIQKRKRVSMYFGETMLPIIILLSKASQIFRTSLVDLGNISNHRTVRQDIENMVVKSINELRRV